MTDLLQKRGIVVPEGVVWDDVRRIMVQGDVPLRVATRTVWGCQRNHLTMQSVVDMDDRELLERKDIGVEGIKNLNFALPIAILGSSKTS